MLSYCNKCKEYSLKVKVYTRKDEVGTHKSRVEFCINKGCGYRKTLPFPKELVNAKELL